MFSRPASGSGTYPKLEMAANTARHTLTLLGEVLGCAKDRVLTESEKDELRRLSRILEQGIPCRPIYNRFVDDFCAALEATLLSESSQNPESVNALLAQLDSLRVMAG